MALSSHTLLGPYEIIEKLGAGGMGVVYRARDGRLEREVAIKVLPEHLAKDVQSLARFQREVRAAAGLSHPNIMAIFDVGKIGNTTYAVMELLHGETLRDRLRKGPMHWQQVAEIGLPIADGLAAAHGKGIIHRDIKPENIFLTSAGGLKILDFGLARLERKSSATNPGDEQQTQSLITKQGVLLGTVCYMAPEQVRGEPLDTRCDLFALGCVLYEMLEGRHPFLNESNVSTMAAILFQQPPELAQSSAQRPVEFDRLIHRCLEKDIAQRIDTAQEIAHALKNITRTAPGTTGVGNEQETLARQQTPAPALAPPSSPSVAVLPFRNMSPDPDNEYFSDGLAEELIGTLTKVDGLRIASRTSSFAFKGKDEDIRKIGSQLNVRTILEGSVRKSGNRLRISAQLVDVADGFELWSETYSRELDDIFEIQEEIAQSITKALAVVLSEEEKETLQKAPTRRGKAYEFYLRGKQFCRQFRRKGFEFALIMFRRAIAVDGNYTEAYAGEADCLSLLYTYWDPDPAHLQRAEEVSRKSLEIDPHSALAHSSHGLVASLKRDRTEAELSFHRAIEIDAKLFHARYFFGRHLLSQGMLNEAAEQLERACVIDPEDYQAASHLTSIYFGLDRKDDAIVASQRCLQAIDNYLSLHPDEARAWYLGAVVLCRLGDTAKSLTWADRALDMDRDEPVTLYNVACVFALQNETDKALDCLKSALEHGFAHKDWITHDSDLNSIRNHPEYGELLKLLK